MCKLLDTIEGFLSSAADTTCVWIDCVAINQHSETNKAANKVGSVGRRALGGVGHCLQGGLGVYGGEGGTGVCA